MYYLRHYNVCLDCEEGHKFKQILKDKFNIECNIITPIFNSESYITISFDVSENHPHFEELLELIPHETSPVSMENLSVEELKTLLRERKSSSIFINSVDVFYYPHYDEYELLNAEWLQMDCINGKLLPENFDKTHSYKCEIDDSKIGIHDVQVGPYIAKSDIKFNSSHFCSTALGDQNVLFCNKATMDLINYSKLKGIKFDSVIKKSTNLPLENTFQLCSDEMLIDSAVVPLKDAERYICEKCKANMVIFSTAKGSYGIKREYLNTDRDIYRIPEIFKYYYPVRNAYGCLIISQRMYKFLHDKKLDRSLRFTPIEII